MRVQRFWGRGTSDLPLPVSAGIRCTTNILEGGELIKMFLNGVDFYFWFAVMRVSIIYKMVTKLFGGKKSQCITYPNQTPSMGRG